MKKIKECISIFVSMLMFLTMIIPVYANGDNYILISDDEIAYDTENIDLDDSIDFAVFGDDIDTPENIIGEDNRTRVTDTTMYPYSSCAFIWITFSDGSVYRGSGSFIDENTVLTSAHVIHDRNKGWATSLIVAPAYDDGDFPYGYYVANRAYTYAGWGSTFQSSYDIGVVKLEEDYSNPSGYFGLSTEVNTSTNITISGYPKLAGEETNSSSMWTISGTSTNVTNEFIYYTMDSTGGQSGSPVYDSQYNIVGIHGYGSSSQNYAVKITEIIYDWIVSKQIDKTVVYRVYNPNNGAHLYTTDVSEILLLIRYGWRYENVAWYAPEEGNPVYRLYNPNNGDHLYTMDEDERDSLVGYGWRYEDIAWYSSVGEEVPVYRLFNPNVRVGTHHYTTDADERDLLINYGWRYEGIVWYGI